MDTASMRDSDFNQRLRDFVVARAAEPAIDWSARRVWWINEIELLLNSMARWLEPAIEAGIAEFVVMPVELEEEFLGRYVTMQASLQLGPCTIEITPRASLVVGGAGRVDIRGPNGTAMLLLITPAKPSDSPAPTAAWEAAEWHLASAHTLAPLTKLGRDCFQQILLDVLDPMG